VTFYEKEHMDKLIQEVKGSQEVDKRSQQSGKDFHTFKNKGTD
jgi:hypothetical protein